MEWYFKIFWFYWCYNAPKFQRLLLWGKPLADPIIESSDPKTKFRVQCKENVWIIQIGPRPVGFSAKGFSKLQITNRILTQPVWFEGRERKERGGWEGNVMGGFNVTLFAYVRREGREWVFNDILRGGEGRY